MVVTDSTEELERRFEIVPDLADGGKVAASVAVVGGTPHRDHVLIGEVIFVTLVDQLVGSRDKGQVIDVAELVRNFVSKQPA